jgi:hypothetical protein
MATKKSYDIFNLPPIKINELFPESQQEPYATSDSNVDINFQSGPRVQSQSLTQSHHRSHVPRLALFKSTGKNIDSINSSQQVTENLSLQLPHKSPILERIIEPKLELESGVDTDKTHSVENQTKWSLSICSLSTVLMILLLIVIGLVVWYFYKKSDNAIQIKQDNQKKEEEISEHEHEQINDNKN